MQNCDYKKESLATIIVLAQNNDVKAIETLIRREQKHIYAIFAHLTDKKEDVSDLTQETLVKMARNIRNLKDPIKFRPWLNRIMSNIFYDYTHTKTQKNIIEINESKLNEISDNLNCEPAERCIFTEIEDLIKNALMTLPQHLRLSIVLREYEGLSYEDISKVTNTTIGTVKSRISRARLKLKEVLADFL
jgi:RNA polymerase sigma-70 factor (ECF subfamily)